MPYRHEPIEGGERRYMRSRRRDTIEIFATLLDCARKEINISNLILKARLCPTTAYWYIDELVLKKMLTETRHVITRRYHYRTLVTSEKGLYFLKIWRTLLKTWNDAFTPLDISLFPPVRMAPFEEVIH
jgi:predicted transcriptional regulator